MAGTRHLRLLVTLLFVSTFIIGASVTAADDSPSPPVAPTPQPQLQPTAYEMLERYNFTQGVTGYVLNAGDGSFEVYRPADCSFRAGSMQVHYSSRVAGHIRPLSITGLEGVKVKVLFSWIGVEQVDRDGDQLRFSAGPISKSFSVDTFANSPQCS